MNPDHWTLTKERYFELVDLYTTKLNIALKERFEMGSKKRGREMNVDLSSRDWTIERDQEGYDWVAYSIMEAERQSRARELL